MGRAEEMNIVAGVFVTILVLAIWAESRRYSKRGRRGHAYELIDIQEEIRYRQEKEREKE